MTFINSAVLSKITHAAGTRHSVLMKRSTFRRRAKVAVDSVDRRSSAGCRVLSLSDCKYSLSPLSQTQID